ncbi:unnamed protein product [Sphagnum compactum]
MGERMKDEEDADRGENERWGSSGVAMADEDAAVAGGAARRRGRGLVLPLSTPRTSRTEERKAGGLIESSGVLQQQRRSQVLVCEEYENR